MRGGRTLTTARLCALLPDVSKAMVYRHVDLLAAGGILEVVDERRVRGAAERHCRSTAAAAVGRCGRVERWVIPTGARSWPTPGGQERAWSGISPEPARTALVSRAAPGAEPRPVRPQVRVAVPLKPRITAGRRG